MKYYFPNGRQLAVIYCLCAVILCLMAVTKWPDAAWGAMMANGAAIISLFHNMLNYETIYITKQ